MTYKQNPNSYVIWSPNTDHKFIKVTLKQIELYEIKTNQLDENLSLNTNIKKIATYNESEIIKTVSWQVSKIDDSLDDTIAIGLTNGVLKILNLQIYGDSDDISQSEKELRPKHLKPFIYISWNPWMKNMLAQVIDRSKGSSPNEPSILIWELPKWNDNKIVLTPTFNNNNNLTPRLIPAPSLTNSNQTNQCRTVGELGMDQPIYEYCRGDIVNSFAWISQSQFICSVNNKHLKLFELGGQNPLKIVNTDATYNICVDIQTNILSSIIDDKIVIWKEDSFDKPILTYVEDSIVENVEWSPLRPGYLCITFKDKQYIKVLDTKIALINSNNEVEHVLFDRCLKTTSEANIICATWHKQIENCILLLLSDERFELVYLRPRRVIGWSVEQKFLCTLNSYLNFISCKAENISNSSLSAKNSDHLSKTNIRKKDNYSNTSNETNICFLRYENKHFLENDISFIMQQRARNGYGLKSQIKDNSYSSMFNENVELKNFWKWIENSSSNCLCNIEWYGNKLKPNPFSGAMDGITDVASVNFNSNTWEITFKLNSIVSRPEEVRWNNMYDSLPFPKYTHSYRVKIFSACGWPFDQCIEKWRSILECLENKERAAAMALVTMNFDVALQYLKRIPSEKGIDSEMLRLCLAGFNTQSGQANNANWSTICKDVLKRLGNSRPYLRLIFNFLIAKKKSDLQFIKSLNILLTDKLAIAALYMDDESLIDFFNHVSNNNLQMGYLEMVVLTGLKSREFIYLLQAYVNRTADVQTAAIAVLQANILTRNAIEKTKKSISWVEGYRNFLDNWLLWLVRADFDIANQYLTFKTNKEMPKIIKPQTLAISKPTLVNLMTISNQNQVYVACGFCGWKISQPSKYTTNLNKHSIQNKTRPDGSLYGNATIPNLAMQSGGCKSTICQHCRKPLPRCSVCLMNMGINGDASVVSHNPQLNIGMYPQKEIQLPSNPIENWFMWCQKCKHGGHTGHLQQWFIEWNECPVSGCKCTCCDLDSSYSLFNAFGQNNDQNNIESF